MKPVVERFQKEHAGKFIKFQMIPFKGSGNISMFHEYGVTGTPTFVITNKEGGEIDRISGANSYEALVAFMESSFKRIRGRK
jgi:thioredoxin-related protein